MQRMHDRERRQHEWLVNGLATHVVRATRLPAVSWLLLLLVPLLAGCGSAPEAAAALPSPTAVVATPSPPATAVPPVVVAQEATPTNLPSFAPQAVEPSPSPAATATPTVAISATASSTLTASAASTPVTTVVAGPTSTPSAGPTFTPPAAPESSPHEHYWFNRPVGPEGVVWTDKHYPYGSTRGGQLRAHHGVEFNVPYNTEIVAVAPGTVVVAGDDAEVAHGPHTDFYGNLVVIRHDFQQNGQPVFSLYGHLNEVLVAEGQQVGGQEVIGLSGASGVADGPHMHLEVRVGANSYDKTRNPLLWLYPFPDRGTIAGQVVWPDGQPVAEAPVSLSRLDGEAPYYGTSTYAIESLNPDPGWNENFVIDDVVAGYYQVTVNAGSKKYKAETWVYPGRTSFVEIVVE